MFPNIGPTTLVSGGSNWMVGSWSQAAVEPFWTRRAKVNESVAEPLVMVFITFRVSPQAITP